MFKLKSFIFPLIFPVIINIITILHYNCVFYNAVGKYFENKNLKTEIEF